MRSRVFLAVAALAVVFQSVWGDPVDDTVTAFVGLTQAARIEAAFDEYTSEPHIAGSARQRAVQAFTRGEWEAMGMDNVYVHESTTLLTYPLYRNVTLVAPTPMALQLDEAEISGDPQTSRANFPTMARTFNGYAPSGDVTAEVVYVNYASPEDFEALAAAGVDVAGAVCLARYGRIFRGTKAMIGASHGCGALLIYSDPADDGAGADPSQTYPNGPWRPRWSVQRGSVQYLSLCPGDPRRLVSCLGPERAYGLSTDPLAEDSFVGVLTPAIPVQPISYGAAEPILAALGGGEARTVLGDDAQGGLPLTYRVGRGPATARVHVEVEWVERPLRNVVGSILARPTLDDGLPNPAREEVIMLGAHADAWVYGAVDPGSGSAVLMEVARALSELKETTGWQPKREIRFHSWDGEEYGLLGSTAFGERDEFRYSDSARIVAYINLDTAVSGTEFRAGATPSLGALIRSVAAVVGMPDSVGGTVAEAWPSQDLKRLGSGSDYSVFLEHYGIPSMDLRFEGEYGVYHSIYDDQAYVKTQIDPGFQIHVSLARVAGAVAIRLADSPVLPFDFSEYAQQLAVYATEVGQLAATRHVAYEPSPALREAIRGYAEAAAAMRDTMASVAATKNTAAQTRLNAYIAHAERHLVSTRGLPQRPFFRHVVQAPGLFQGYAADVFPGIADALRAGDAAAASEQDRVIATHIAAAAAFLQRGAQVQGGTEGAGADASGAGAGAGAAVLTFFLLLLCTGGIVAGLVWAVRKDEARAPLPLPHVAPPVSGGPSLSDEDSAGRHSPIHDVP